MGSWFDENETAQVTRLMKNLDPNFDRESFERELREYIVPEVVDAYLSADQEALKAWCGEAVSLLISAGYPIRQLLSRYSTFSGPRWNSTTNKVWSAKARSLTFARSM